MAEHTLAVRWLVEERQHMTALQLSEKLGIAKRNALMYIAILREDKRVRIVGWRRPLVERHLVCPGDWVPVYGPKDGKRDEPKPERLSRKERQQTYRVRNKAKISIMRRNKRLLAKEAANAPVALS